jgi:hypothetical protein
MKRRVKRALVDLKNIARNLANALRDSPAMERFEGDGLEDE